MRSVQSSTAYYPEESEVGQGRVKEFVAHLGHQHGELRGLASLQSSDLTRSKQGHCDEFIEGNRRGRRRVYGGHFFTYQSRGRSADLASFQGESSHSCNV